MTTPKYGAGLCGERVVCKWSNTTGDIIDVLASGTIVLVRANQCLAFNQLKGG